LEIPCSEKSAKSETPNFGLRFLRFFFLKMPLQKNVKSRVFWISKKNVKNVFSNYGRDIEGIVEYYELNTHIRGDASPDSV